MQPDNTPASAVLHAPAPPGNEYDGGHGWMDRLTGTGWYPVPDWGNSGWNLGRWPYVVIAAYDPPPDHPQVYGLATYVEGDIDVTSFPTRAERDAATDRIAAFYWRNYDTGPDDLAANDADLAPQHRGPFSWERLDTEAN
jgi:hypothetical protein